MTESTSSAPAAPTTPQANSPETTNNPAPAAAAAPEAQLLFDPKLTGENKPEGDPKPGEQKPADQPEAKPAAADMKKYLEEKLGDKKSELEGKTDEEIAKLYDEKKAEEAAAESKVPPFDIEKLTAPDDMPISAEDKQAFGDIAKELNLTQEGAQKLVNLEVERQKRQVDFWDQTKKGWREQTEKDPDIGGANLEASIKTANAMVREFGGTPEQKEELVNDLVLLGLGQKRSFIRLLVNIGKQFGNDKLPGGGTPVTPKKDAASTLWPDMPRAG